MKVFGSNYLIKLLGISSGFGMSPKKSRGRLGCRKPRKMGNLSGGISAQGLSHGAQVDETVSDRGYGLLAAPHGTARHSPERRTSEQFHPTIL